MEVLLHVGGGGRIYPGRSWDLSANGVFVLLERPVPMDARVEMTLTKPDRSETFFLTGQVVHAAPGRGVGVKFSTLSTRASSKLHELLARLALESGESEAEAPPPASAPPAPPAA